MLDLAAVSEETRLENRNERKAEPNLSVTFSAPFLWKRRICNSGSSIYNRARKIMPHTFFSAAADLA